MSEAQQAAATAEGTAVAASEEAAEASTTTQDASAQEPDWKALSRKWEAQSKANKTALDDLTGKFTAVDTERTELATKVQTYESEKERAALVSGIAKASGVPANALRGNTREELEAHAADLAELIKPSGPVIPGQERTPDKILPSEDREFVGKLFAQN